MYAFSSKMAEEVLKKLEEQLNCSICLDTYTDPKLLQCFHVYCRKCLVPLGVRDQEGKDSLTCPACRQVTPIPDRGVAGLKPAFHINHLLEIYKDSLKKLENPAVTTEGATPADPNPSHCFVHKDKEELYCETCDELICLRCIMKYNQHYDHDYKELNEAFEGYRKEILSSLEPMEIQVMVLKKALTELRAHCAKIIDKRATIEDNIYATFRRLREVLTVRETELISQLHQMTQAKLKGLSAQSDQIEITLAKLNSCLHFVRESLRTGNESNVLMMKANTVQQVKELTTPFQQDMLKPNTEADMIFSALADMTAMCQDYGQVHESGSLDFSNCYITGKGAEVAAVGEKSTAILQTINVKGKPCEEPIKSLKCEIVSEITGTRLSCSVERRGQSQYEISYQPTIKGRHQLHVIVDGQHVKGSPSRVLVNLPIQKLSTPILTIGRVKGPWGVAINQRGEVVVTERDGHCVSVFSPSGEKLRSFGYHLGQLQKPRGLAVDDMGNILVADGGNCRIQKFTTEGHFIASVGTKGSGPLQFKQPNNIAFNAYNSKIYVVDYLNHNVQVLNSDLTFSITFGRQGNSKGEFDYPQSISCDSTGNVYVADRVNHRIQVFTAEGKFLRMFGRFGQGKGELDNPISIAVDNGFLYIGEAVNSRVSVFTSEGQYVTSFGKEGKPQGELNFPSGLVVDCSGVVYVCDSHNNSLQVF